MPSPLPQDAALDDADFKVDALTARLHEALLRQKAEAHRRLAVLHDGLADLTVEYPAVAHTIRVSMKDEADG